ncbi:MAG: hypothetical protein JF607_17485 [Burkholderiales bacterium]|jgi:hypothetical protein|nr:hypothetical protein [Burkholderiales bacterium]
MSTLLTDGPVDEVAYLQRVHDLIGRQLARGRTPELQALAAETWRRLTEAAQLRDRLVFRYTGPTLQDFVVGSAAAPVAVRLRSDGAHAVALALLNPGKLVRLGAGRSRRAWHAAICRATEAIDQVDGRVAARLAFAAERDAPGFRLSQVGGQVWIRWRQFPAASSVSG